MPNALKKYLTRMALEPGDFVVLRPNHDATNAQIEPFAREVAAVLADAGLGPLIVVPPLVDLRRLGHDDLAKLGLCRVIPEVAIGAGALNWEAYEDQAHQLVRLAFEKAREEFERPV